MRFTCDLKGYRPTVNIMEVAQLLVSHQATSTSATKIGHREKTIKLPLGCQKQRHTVVSCPRTPMCIRILLESRLQGLFYKLAQCIVTVARSSAIGDAIVAVLSCFYLLISQYIKGILLKTICMFLKSNTRSVF